MFGREGHDLSDSRRHAFTDKLRELMLGGMSKAMSQHFR